MITLDNYEEFFLLYVDNELSAADREAVEKFAAGNPDLQQELESLLQCRLEPANDLFFDKRESLLIEAPPVAAGSPKTNFAADATGQEQGSSGVSGREEHFLSYIDGELDESGRLAVEDLVRSNPSLLRELELLQQAVNIPDPSVVFLHKETLYRPKASLRVFGLPPALFRFAAAAVVLFVIGLLVFSRIGKNGTNAGIAKTGKVNQNRMAAGMSDHKNKGTTVTPGPGTALHSSETQQERPGGEKGRTPDLAGTKRSAPREKVRELARTETGDLAAKTGVVRKPAVEPDSRQTAAEQAGRSAAEQGSEGASETAGRGTAEQGKANTGETASAVTAQQPGINAAGPGSHETPPVSKELSSFATQALLKDAALSDEDGLTLQQASPKKNKLRGIFRKVSRVLEKTAGSDDPDSKHGVLIGNLQIALK